MSLETVSELSVCRSFESFVPLLIVKECSAFYNFFKIKCLNLINFYLHILNNLL